MNPNFTTLTHGLTRRGTRPPNLYRRWGHMIQRCHNPNDRDYARYGAKGVRVCDRWRLGEDGVSGYTLFVADMGIPSSAALSIDRIDVYGEYAPDNCRWATPVQQARNRTNNTVLYAFGISKLQSEWCEQYGISHQALRHRLKTGMSIEDALSKPVANYRSRKVTP